MKGVAVMVPTADPVLVELLARDAKWIVFDLEHGAIGDGEVATAVLIAQRAGAATAVRCGVDEKARVARFLDAGGLGVIAARVDSPDEAMDWLSGITPPPDGTRGIGACRATDFGRSTATVAQPWFCAQIETGAGVAAVEQIAAVSGVDALLVGTRDLSYSLGVPGRLTHPSVAEACQRVEAACRESGIAYATVFRKDGGRGTATGPMLVPLTVVLAEGLDSFPNS